MLGNYSFKEYALLITLSDSIDELGLIDEQLREDQQNRLIDPFDYIQLKMRWTLRLTDITIEEAKKKTE